MTKLELLKHKNVKQYFFIIMFNIMIEKTKIYVWEINKIIYYTKIN